MDGIYSNKGPGWRIKITSSGGESANWGGAASVGRTEDEMELVEASKHMVTPRLDWLRGRVRVVVWLNWQIWNRQPQSLILRTFDNETGNVQSVSPLRMDQCELCVCRLAVKFVLTASEGQTLFGGQFVKCESITSPRPCCRPCWSSWRAPCCSSSWPCCGAGCSSSQEWSGPPDCLQVINESVLPNIRSSWGVRC